MHLYNVAVNILALSGSAVAFSDSSPLVLVSTEPFVNTPNNQHLQTSSEATKTVKSLLATCPSKNYLLITQTGLHAVDLQKTDESYATSHLKTVVKDSRIKGRYNVSEVIGHVSSDNMFAFIDAACTKAGQEANIQEQRLSSLPVQDGPQASSENDALADKIGSVAVGDSFTILLLPTSREPSYEAEFFGPLRMDLKRNVGNVKEERDDDETDRGKLPLFEKYQFFSPGIFMAIATAIILFSILYVGLSALSSLEVSYGAFSKEMGPAAQKK